MDKLDMLDPTTMYQTLGSADDDVTTICDWFFLLLHPGLEPTTPTIRTLRQCSKWCGDNSSGQL